MASLEIVPSTGDTLAVGTSSKPISGVVTSGSVADASGNSATPSEMQTAYDHSQTTGNPHGTIAADVGADPAGTGAAAVGAHESTYDHPAIAAAAATGAAHVAIVSGNPHGTTAADVGADPVGTAAAAVSAHNALGSAAHSLDAGSQNVYLNTVRMNTAPTVPAHTEGTLYWDNQDRTLNVMTDVSGTVIQLGQEQVLRAVNDSGAQIDNGQVVYIDGAQGSRPTIALAQGDTQAHSSKDIGVATADIADHGTGYVTTFGLVRDLDTDVAGWTEGDMLWLSATVAGGITNARPAAPLHAVYLGVLVRKHPTQGVIFVNVQNGYELSELHDVSEAAPTDGQALVWNDTTKLWTPTTLPTADLSAAVILAPTTSARNVIQPTGAAVIPLVVKGASAQTANLQEWQDSAGIILASITPGGGASVKSITVNPSTAPRNEFFGSGAGTSTTTGTGYNTSLGWGSLASLTTGFSTTAIGTKACHSLTDGSMNVGIGVSALRDCVSGSSNVAVGWGCSVTTTGSNNTAVGWGAGAAVTSGGDNVFIGYYADLVSTQRSGVIAIGHNAKVDQNDSCVIGKTGTTAPLLGLNTTQPGAQIHANARTASTIGAIIRGASAQTANLQQWQDSTGAKKAAVLASGCVETGSACYFYMGDSATDGSWRIGRSGNDLVFERRESGSWVTKQTMGA